MFGLKTTPHAKNTKYYVNNPDIELACEGVALGAKTHRNVHKKKAAETNCLLNTNF